MGSSVEGYFLFMVIVCARFSSKVSVFARNMFDFWIIKIGVADFTYDEIETEIDISYIHRNRRFYCFNQRTIRLN